MAESGGRAVERKLTLPVDADRATMIGVKPLFSGRSLGEGENASFDVVAGRARRQDAGRAAGLRYELLKIETRYQWYRRDGRWEYEPVKSTRRVADGQIDVARRQAGPHLGCRCSGAAIASKSRAPTPTARSPRSRSTPASTPRRAPTRRTCSRSRSTSRSTSRATRMTVAVTARTAGRVTLNVVGDRLLATVTQDVQAGHRAHHACRSATTGAPAPMWSRRLRRPLDAQAQRMPGRAIGVQWFSIDRKARTLALDMTLPQLHAAEHARCACRSRSTGSPPARRRASSSPRSMSAFSISPTTSRRRRTTIISASAG